MGIRASFRALAVTAWVALAGCATTPLQPDPTVDVTGEWRIVAINGEPTGGDESFSLKVAPPRGSAQFGCNAGSGSVAIGNGWLVTGNWISTAAGCLPRELMRFERRGFRILGEPLAIERRSGNAVRLRNDRGSIDLVRPPPITAERIIGTWNVDAINGLATHGGSNFRVTLTHRQLAGRFGCNRYRGEYVVENGRFRTLGGDTTEMACEMLEPATGRHLHGVPVMELEERAFRVLRSEPEIRLQTHGRMTLVGPAGSIDFSRAP